MVGSGEDMKSLCFRTLSVVRDGIETPILRGAVPDPDAVSKAIVTEAA